MNKTRKELLQQKIQFLLRQKENLKRQIKNCEKFEQLIESEGWKAVEYTVKKRIAVNEKALDNFLSDGFGHDNLVAALERRNNLKLFISMPKDFILDKEGFEEELSKVEGKIHELRERD